MCGVIGFISKNETSGKKLDSFLHQLIHRGLNDCGEWSDNHVYLGHTRLSILDLSSLGH